MSEPEQAARRLQDLLVGHVLTTMLALGHRAGLLEALSDGPAAADEVADRAGADRRYTREWLGALVAGGLVAYDPACGTFTLPAGFAELLTGAHAANLAPTADMLIRLTAMAPDVAARFADGAGIPAATFADRAGDALGAPRRHLYEEQFIDGFLGPVPGLHDRLRAGARVLDVGCGTGQVAGVLARAFPAATIEGVDVAPAAVAIAEAEHGGAPNLHYRTADAVELDDDGRYDVVLAVDVVHDLPRPAEALARIRRALAPDGTFVMVDIGFSGDLVDATDDPAAALATGISVLHCLPVGLTDGGAGLGAMWGTQAARSMLATAGFTDVTVLDAPRPQNAIYVAR